METLPSKGTDERDTAVVVEWEGPEGPGEVLGILFSVFLMTISVAVPALGVLYGLAIIFPQFGVFIYGALLVIVIYMMMWLSFHNSIANKGDAVGTAGLNFIFVFLMAFGFGQMCRYWNLRFGGFVGHGSGYWDWTLYALSWIFDNFSANIGQIFGWNITDIQPVSWGARAITWVYNIFLDFFALAVFVRYAPALVGIWRR